MSYAMGIVGYQDIIERLEGVAGKVIVCGEEYEIQDILNRMDCYLADRVWDRLYSERFGSDVFGALPPLPPPTLQDFVSAYTRSHFLFLGE